MDNTNSMMERLDEFLLDVQKPSRYIGGETPGHEDTLRSEKRSPELLVRASIHAAPRYGGADAHP